MLRIGISKINATTSPARVFSPSMAVEVQASLPTPTKPCFPQPPSRKSLLRPRSLAEVEVVRSNLMRCSGCRRWWSWRGWGRSCNLWTSGMIVGAISSSPTSCPHPLLASSCSHPITTWWAESRCSSSKITTTISTFPGEISFRLHRLISKPSTTSTTPTQSARYRSQKAADPPAK